MKSWSMPALIGLVCVVFLAPSLLTGRILLPGNLLGSYVPFMEMERVGIRNPLISDVIEQIYPYQRFLREELWEGRLPLWNPFVLAGTPFVATTVSSVFSPLKWLLMWVPHELSYEWSALLKLILAGTGIYFFCLRIGLCRLSAAVGGVTYLFSGYQVYFLLFPNAFVAALFGWELLVIEDFVRTRRRHNLTFLSLLVGCAFLAGHVESAMLQALACGLYVEIRDWRATGSVALAGLLGVLLSCVVLVPFVEFLSQSATIQLRTFDSGNPFFIDVRNWHALVMPYSLGAPQTETLGKATVQGALFIGLLPVCLALFAFVRSRRREIGKAVLTVGVAASLILFGAPVFFDLFTSLPVLRQGNHQHIMQILQAALAVLAAAGLDNFVSHSRMRKWPVFVMGSILLAASTYAYLDPSTNPDAADGAYFFFFRELPLPIFPIWVGLTTLGTLLLIGRSRFRWLPFGTITATGVFYGTFFTPAVPADSTLKLKPAVVAQLEEFSHERFVASGVATFPPNTNMLWRLKDLRGYESLTTSRVPSFFNLLTRTIDDPHQFVDHLDPDRLQLLRRAGCSLVLSPRRLDLEGLTTLRDEFPFLYRIENAGRVGWVAEVVNAASGSEALALIVDEPASVTVLENAGPVSTHTGPVADSDRVVWIEDTPDRIELEVSTERRRWLVVRDAYYPGWVATVNGVKTPIRRADYLFRAVEVPAGNHTIVFEYRPLSFKIGIAGSLGALALLLVVGLNRVRRVERR